MKIYADMIHGGHSIGRFTIETFTDWWALYFLGYFEVYNTKPIKVVATNIQTSNGPKAAHQLQINGLTNEFPLTDLKESINVQTYYLTYTNSVLIMQQGNEDIDPETVVAKCHFSSKITQTICRSDFTIVDFAMKF